MRLFLNTGKNVALSSLHHVGNTNRFSKSKKTYNSKVNFKIEGYPWLGLVTFENAVFQEQFKIFFQVSLSTEKERESVRETEKVGEIQTEKMGKTKTKNGARERGRKTEKERGKVRWKERESRERRQIKTEIGRGRGRVRNREKKDKYRKKETKRKKAREKEREREKE